MKTCDDVLDLLPDALPFLGADGAELRDHLTVCAACAEAAEAMAETAALLRAHAPVAPELGKGFADRVLAALGPTPAQRPRPAGGLLRAAAVALAAFGLGLVFGRGWEEGFPQGPPAPTAAGAAPSLPAAPATPAASPPAPRSVGRPVPLGRRLGVALDAEGDPLGHYVRQAARVLEALERLDGRDAAALDVVARHVEQAGLLDAGERLLLLLREEPGSELARGLAPLVAGTQLVLRKVRHARDDDDPRRALWTLRQEVEQTQLLETCKAVLALRRRALSREPL
ncbi:MAG: hypothetical protein D6731_19710 [Planctomycetota bacterium]|nr:MAG: hypothetical protein D6731_19710 [Planctomycetota bacterium]